MNLQEGLDYLRELIVQAKDEARITNEWKERFEAALKQYANSNNWRECFGKCLNSWGAPTTTVGSHWHWHGYYSDPWELAERAIYPELYVDGEDE